VALIGQIAIAMRVETSKLARGLSDSAAMVRNFQRSASADFGGASRLMASGLKNVSDGFQGIGIVAAGATKGAATFVRNWVDAAHYIYGKGFTDPLVAAAKASADALIYTYSGLGKKIGGVLSKAGGPLGAAAKASFASLDYVYGPAIKAIGSGFATAASVAARALTPLAASVGTVAVGLGKMALGAGQAAIGLGKLAAAGAIKGMQGLGAATMRMVATVREGINVLGRFAGVASLVAGFALVKVAKGAMALGEQTDRARVIFGDGAKDIVSQSKLMATAFGVSRSEFLQFSSAFGTILEGAGYVEKDAATLSKHLVQLAIDQSSIVHIPIAEAMEKLQSGLQGNIRPLRELGISIADADLKAHAAKVGIGQLGAELTESQKIQARVSLMTERSAKAHGNLALTADSAANSTRSLAGRMQNLADTVGTALLSVLGPAISEVTVGIQALQAAWDSSSLAASSASIGVVGGAQAQTTSIGMVQQAIGKVADVWQLLGTGFSYVQSYITNGLMHLIGVIEGLAKALDYVLNLMHFADTFGSKANTAGGLAGMSDALKNLSEEQYKTFQAKLIAPAASEGINKAFDAARAQIASARKELAAQGQVDLSKIKPKSEQQVGKEVKFASAAALGSQEATNAILRSRFGKGGKATADEAKKTANNTAKANEYLSKIATAVSTQAAGVLVPI
jgi:hypothetical protein